MKILILNGSPHIKGNTSSMTGISSAGSACRIAASSPIMMKNPVQKLRDIAEAL